MIGFGLDSPWLPGQRGTGANHLPLPLAWGDSEFLTVTFPASEALRQ